MKYKVLLICSDFRWYADSYKKAFENNDCEVVLLASHIGLYKYQIFKRCFAFFGYKNLHDKEKKMAAFNEKVIRNARSFQPNIVYSILSIDLYRETIVELKKKSKMVLLLGDSLGQYIEAESNVDLFDLIYSYEWKDINFLKGKGYRVLPQMGVCDEKLYYHIPCEKKYDVTFVGKMYPERKEILERLIVDLQKVNFKFYGEYAPLRKPWQFLKWLMNRRARECFVNRNTSYNETNNIYNQSKIVLDIHCAQSTMGWSSRLPEISCTKTFQIVDYNPIIENEFGGNIVCYKNYIELVKLIQHYLDNPAERDEMAYRGYRHVVSMTVTNSIKRMLDDLVK